ncbi:hypothetical protein Tco_1070090, partial [Tanacetum coccineum]
VRIMEEGVLEKWVLGWVLLSVLHVERGDDDNSLFAMHNLLKPVSWLGSHTKSVIAAMSGVSKTLAVMIFIICCLAADSGRMAECEYCLPQQPP